MQEQTVLHHEHLALLNLRLAAFEVLVYSACQLAYFLVVLQVVLAPAGVDCCLAVVAVADVSG